MAQEIKRIEKEFIFKTLMDGDSPLALHYKQMRYRGKLVSADKKELVLDAESPVSDDIAKGIEVRLFFRFRGTPITCTSKVRLKENSMIWLEAPKVVYRDLTRNFERVKAGSNMSVNLIINGERLNIDFPASESFYEPDVPDLDLNFDATRISDLLRAFRERASSLSTENKITMFRDRRPANAIENLLALSGKILLLPFTDLDNIAIIRSKLGTSIAKEADVHRVFREVGEDTVLVASQIQEYLNKLKSRRVWHELYCPVLFREYVVGYIFLMRADANSTPFSHDQLEMVYQFSRLLSYALKLNGYFKSMPVKQEFTNSELVDISGSGLLFSYPPDGPSIQLYTDVELTVKIGDLSLPINGRVMRKFKDVRQIYLAVQYTNLSDENRHKMLSELYGDNYDGQIEIQDLEA